MRIGHGIGLAVSLTFAAGIAVGQPAPVAKKPAAPVANPLPAAQGIYLQIIPDTAVAADGFAVFQVPVRNTSTTNAQVQVNLMSEGAQKMTQAKAVPAGQTVTFEFRFKTTISVGSDVQDRSVSFKAAVTGNAVKVIVGELSLNKVAATAGLARYVSSAASASSRELGSGSATGGGKR